MRTLLFFVLAAVWLYFIVEASMTRNPNLLPRYAWVLLTLLLPGLGTLLWFVFGRQRRIRAAAPDDDPRFLRSLDDEVWKKRLRDWRNRGEGK
ncbi:MAG: PLDc N-terminal domain-containing protein [Candidatus Nanopelagicales bacterium]